VPFPVFPVFLWSPSSSRHALVSPTELSNSPLGSGDLPCSATPPNFPLPCSRSAAPSIHDLYSFSSLPQGNLAFCSGTLQGPAEQCLCEPRGGGPLSSLLLLRLHNFSSHIENPFFRADPFPPFLCIVFSLMDFTPSVFACAMPSHPSFVLAPPCSSLSFHSCFRVLVLSPVQHKTFPLFFNLSRLPFPRTPFPVFFCDLEQSRQRRASSGHGQGAKVPCRRFLFYSRDPARDKLIS